MPSSSTDVGAGQELPGDVPRERLCPEHAARELDAGEQHPRVVPLGVGQVARIDLGRRAVVGGREPHLAHAPWLQEDRGDRHAVLRRRDRAFLLEEDGREEQLEVRRGRGRVQPDERCRLGDVRRQRTAAANEPGEEVARALRAEEGLRVDGRQDAVREMVAQVPADPRERQQCVDPVALERLRRADPESIEQPRRVDGARGEHRLARGVGLLLVGRPGGSGRPARAPRSTSSPRRGRRSGP